MTKEEAEALALDVERTLLAAGLTIANENGPVTQHGFVASGVGVGLADMRVWDRGWEVMLTWGMADSADPRTVDIMLAAVAEVLRVHGFQAEKHPVGGAYLLVGRER